jgi:hypothetical protein
MDAIVIIENPVITEWGTQLVAKTGQRKDLAGPPNVTRQAIAAHPAHPMSIRQFLPDGERNLGPVQTNPADPYMPISRRFD